MITECQWFFSDFMIINIKVKHAIFYQFIKQLTSQRVILL
jgi:hypothetical protein